MSEQERSTAGPESPAEDVAIPQGGAPQAPPEPPIVEMSPAEAPVEPSFEAPIEPAFVAPPVEPWAGELPELPTEAPAVGLPPEAPTPAPCAPEVNDDDRLMAGLAWFSMAILQLPLVSVVLLLAEGNKGRPFQRYHAITSILFWVVSLVYEGLAAIVFTILTVVSLGCLAACLWVIFFVPHLVCLFYAFQAYSGKQMEIPVLSDFARKQGWV